MPLQGAPSEVRHSPPGCYLPLFETPPAGGHKSIHSSAKSAPAGTVQVNVWEPGHGRGLDPLLQCTLKHDQRPQWTPKTLRAVIGVSQWTEPRECFQALANTRGGPVGIWEAEDNHNFIRNTEGKPDEDLSKIPAPNSTSAKGHGAIVAEEDDDGVGNFQIHFGDISSDEDEDDGGGDRSSGQDANALHASGPRMFYSQPGAVVGGLYPLASTPLCLLLVNRTSTGSGKAVSSSLSLLNSKSSTTTSIMLLQGVTCSMLPPPPPPTTQEGSPNTVWAVPGSPPTLSGRAPASHANPPLPPSYASGQAQGIPRTAHPTKPLGGSENWQGISVANSPPLPPLPPPIGTVRQDGKYAVRMADPNRLPESRVACRFWGRARGCRAGSSCKWLHHNGAGPSSSSLFSHLPRKHHINYGETSRPPLPPPAAQLPLPPPLPPPPLPPPSTPPPPIYHAHLRPTYPPSSATFQTTTFHQQQQHHHEPYQQWSHQHLSQNRLQDSYQPAHFKKHTSPKPCHFWLHRGVCRSGDACKWRHDLQSNGKSSPSRRPMNHEQSAGNGSSTALSSETLPPNDTQNGSNSLIPATVPEDDVALPSKDEEENKQLKQQQEHVLNRSDSEPLDFPPPPVMDHNYNLASVLAAVAQDPSALEYASATWQEHREVVLTAVREDGSALQFASTELRADREIVLTAVKASAAAIAYASRDLQADAWVTMAARHSQGAASPSNALRNGRATSSEEAARFPSSLTLPASFDQPADAAATALDEVDEFGLP